MTVTERAVLTPEEVAEYLRVNPQTVYRLLRAGKCPGVKIGRQWRIRRADLDGCFLGHSSRQHPRAPQARES
jgi:excisionase family DNA binding protein